MARMLLRLFVFTAAIIMAAACGGGGGEVTSDRYYLSSDIPASAFDNTQVKVQLNEILNTGGIVLEQNDVNVYVAKNHRWASNLSQQLSAIFYTKINGKSFSKDRTFNLYFSKFNGSIDGHAHIIMSVKVIDQSGQQLLVKDYVYDEPTEQDGYAALVLTLKNGYNQVIDTFIADGEKAAAEMAAKEEAAAKAKEEERETKQRGRSSYGSQTQSW